MATGASILVEVDDAVVSAALGRLAAAGRDTATALDAIGAALLASTQQRFERETGPAGGAWARLARRTVRERARLGYVPIRILRRKVAPGLYGSLTYQADATVVEVGTNNPYAAIHQFGGTIKRAARTQTVYRRYDAKTDELSGRFVARKRANVAFDHPVAAHEITIPARPYLGIDEADRAEIVATIEAHIRAAVPEAFA